MNDEVSLYFREIMDKVGMEYIPDSGVKYHKTLKFSSVLNIKDRFEDFFKLNRCYYTNQRCFRVTDKTPRRFHRLTHDRNKIWYYTYLREQY